MAYTVTIPLRELRQRLGEVPLHKDDCYLISILDEDGEEFGAHERPDGEYVEGAWPIPFMARKFPPVVLALNEDEKNWGYQYGGDTVRLGLNTPTVPASVRFVFRWGVSSLTHVEGPSGFCVYCGERVRGHVTDCLGRRAHELADAVLAGDLGTAKVHAKYIKKNHRVG